MKIEVFNPDVHQQMFEKFMVDAYGTADHALLNPVFLDWQFRQNPLAKDNAYSILLLLRDQHILAMVGYIPVQVKIANQLYESCHPVNLASHADFRNFGFGALLLKHLIGIYPVIVNPGSSLEGLKLCEKLGMHNHGILDRYVAVFSSQKATPFYKGEANGNIAIACHARLVGGVFRVEQTVPRLPEKQFGDNTWSRTVKSRDYLAWRYDQHPSFNYQYFTHLITGEFLVFRMDKANPGEIPFCRVVDYIGDINNLASMLDGFAGFLNDEDVAFADFLCGIRLEKLDQNPKYFLHESKYKGITFTYLFQPIDFKKQGVRLLIGASNQAIPTDESMFCVLGDSDQDRPNSVGLA